MATLTFELGVQSSPEIAIDRRGGGVEEYGCTQQCASPAGRRNGEGQGRREEGEWRGMGGKDNMSRR